ncbi:hypothetical protein V6Z11_A06G110200 [Gossypium hirsutum]
MLEGKAVIEDTDMPLKLQARALASASRALDLLKVLTAFLLLHILKRNLTRCMGVDGNAWWVQISVVSSPISKELSSILLWELSTFSSSTQPILFLVDGS